MPVYNSLCRHVGLGADGSQEPPGVHGRLYDLLLNLEDLPAEEVMSDQCGMSVQEILRCRVQNRRLLRDQKGRQVHKNSYTDG